MLNLASQLKLYADDTVVYNSNKDPQVAHIAKRSGHISGMVQ